MNIICSRILLGFILAFLCLDSYAVSQNVILRDEIGKYSEKEVELTDLNSDNSFEGKYFKIVLGKSDEAIPFNVDDPSLLLKAATTYYHLTKARDYFVKTLKSDYVATLPQLVVRLEITNTFHERGHFAHDNFEPQYNNATSIIAGVGIDSYGVAPWGIEIWFRPKKVIEIEGNTHPYFDQMNDQVFGQFHTASFEGVLRYFLTRLAMSINTSRSLEWSDFRGYFSTLIVSESIYYAARGLDYIGRFHKTDYFIETALVPEIIYHEFAHVALSDKLVLTHSSPVNEGLADYFSTAVSGLTTIGDSIEKYSSAVGKNGENNLAYNYAFESISYANIDFVMALLWDIKKEIPLSADELIWALKDKLTSKSNIRNDLLKTLLSTCSQKCKSPTSDRYKLMAIFKNRGF